MLFDYLNFLNMCINKIFLNIFLWLMYKVIDCLWVVIVEECVL